MFHLVKVNDVVRIPPAKFKDDLKETISEVVTDENVGKITPEYGVVLGVVNIDEVGDASVVLGDGAAFVNACYDVLVFKPASQNVYEGEVKDIAEFGAFMGLGPFDGLVHVSQIMDDFISYDPKNMCFVGKETNRTLSKDDTIMAKLVSVSMKGNVTSPS